MSKISTLDALMVIWNGRDRIGFFPYIGTPNVNVLWGFVLGVHLATRQLGIDDSEYLRFSEWLRDVKREFPPEGWRELFLKEAQGDHLAACIRFLDRVAEFRGE